MVAEKRSRLSPELRKGGQAVQASHVYPHVRRMLHGWLVYELLGEVSRSIARCPSS